MYQTNAELNGFGLEPAATIDRVALDSQYVAIHAGIGGDPYLFSGDFISGDQTDVRPPADLNNTENGHPSQEYCDQDAGVGDDVVQWVEHLRQRQLAHCQQCATPARPSISHVDAVRDAGSRNAFRTVNETAGISATTTASTAMKGSCTAREMPRPEIATSRESTSLRDMPPTPRRMDARKTSVKPRAAPDVSHAPAYAPSRNCEAAATMDRWRTRARKHAVVASCRDRRRASKESRKRR